MDDVRKQMIAQNCSVKHENVISAPDVKSIYEVPILLKNQEFDIKLLSEFGIAYKRSKESMFRPWEDAVKRQGTVKNEISIGIVGKYFDTGDFKLEDSYISVIHAVHHAAIANDVKANIVWIDSKEFEGKNASENIRKRLSGLHGLIIPGGFGKTGIEGKINAAGYARKNKLPFLGICYGFQCAVIEYARDECGMADAHTTEIDEKTKHPVVMILADQKKKLEAGDFGGSMRLGTYPAKLIKGSLIESLYGNTNVSERHRHRYEVNTKYIEVLEKNGLIFSGRSPDGLLIGRNAANLRNLEKNVQRYFSQIKEIKVV